MKVDARLGKDAETQFRVLQSNQDTSLIEARPLTGRTHQIRVHLADSGHPVLGDALYGPMFDNPQPATARPLRWLCAPFRWLTTTRFRSAAFASPRGRRSFANGLVLNVRCSSRREEALLNGNYKARKEVKASSPRLLQFAHIPAEFILLREPHGPPNFRP